MEKSFAGNMGPGQAGGLSVALAPDAGRDTLDRRGRLRAAGRQVFGLAAGAAGFAPLPGSLPLLGLFWSQEGKFCLAAQHRQEDEAKPCQEPPRHRIPVEHHGAEHQRCRQPQRSPESF